MKSIQPTSHTDKGLSPASSTKKFFKARMSKDARFDGVFFTAVETTGIYCRPICPANPPLEKNVSYFDTAVAASLAGFRPCLRCHPDSAPKPSEHTASRSVFSRALKLIQQGALQDQSLETLASRLDISSRHLRDVFQKELGISPKRYAIYQQCLFAKQLLHQSNLKVIDIAFAAGFNSVRRFNEAMQHNIGLSPREIRQATAVVSSELKLQMHYRPPYAWKKLFSFLSARTIDGLEWGDERLYGRTIAYGSTIGYFEVSAKPEKHCFEFTLQLNELKNLYAITQHLRGVFDLDAPMQYIDADLHRYIGKHIKYQKGLRIPGIWNSFEAGMRAVLGQQVSVGAARNLVTALVENLGQEFKSNSSSARFLFPQPQAVLDSDLAFFRMPQARKDTLRRLADHYLNSSEPDDVDQWLDLKGIGPWTANYVKLRASKDPDIWLAGDAGLKNALKGVESMPDIELASPWRSYLTFQLWNQL